MSETAYEGWFVITDQTGPAGQWGCSCGALIWDIAAHIRFHGMLGQLCEDKR